MTEEAGHPFGGARHRKLVVLSVVEQRRSFTARVWELYGPLAVIALVVFGIRRARQNLATAGLELDVPSGYRPFSRRPECRPASPALLRLNSLSFITRLPRGVAIRLLQHRRAPFHTTRRTACSPSCTHYWRQPSLSSRRSSWFSARLNTLPRTFFLWLMHSPSPGFSDSRSALEAVTVGHVKAPDKRTPGYLRATMGQPNVLIHLTRPLLAAGAYGTTRAVTRVGFSVDDPNTFSLALAQTPA